MDRTVTVTSVRGDSRLRGWAAYGAMLVSAVVLFLVIDSLGGHLTAPTTASTGHPAARAVGKSDALVHVLIALTAVVAVGRLLGLLFRYIGQPPVIGEVVGG